MVANPSSLYTCVPALLENSEGAVGGETLTWLIYKDDTRLLVLLIALSLFASRYRICPIHGDRPGAGTSKHDLPWQRIQGRSAGGHACFRRTNFIFVESPQTCFVKVYESKFSIKKTFQLKKFVEVCILDFEVSKNAQAVDFGVVLGLGWGTASVLFFWLRGALWGRWPQAMNRSSTSHSWDHVETTLRPP